MLTRSLDGLWLWYSFLSVKSLSAALESVGSVWLVSLWLGVSKRAISSSSSSSSIMKSSSKGFFLGLMVWCVSWKWLVVFGSPGGPTLCLQHCERWDWAGCGLPWPASVMAAWRRSVNENVQQCGEVSQKTVVAGKRTLFHCKWANSISYISRILY